jgi:hypothetical protein
MGGKSDRGQKVKVTAGVFLRSLLKRNRKKVSTPDFSQEAKKANPHNFRWWSHIGYTRHKKSVRCEGGRSGMEEEKSISVRVSLLLDVGTDLLQESLNFVK